MTAARVEPALYPPLATGGPILRGLSNIAFAHELPGYGLTPVRSNVLYMARLAHATLNEQLAERRRQRRTPFYWIDRSLRALLGIPAYILSLFLRMPAGRIDRSPFGPALRALAAASEVAGIYFGGMQAGWW
jgi:hypothetical protein